MPLSRRVSGNSLLFQGFPKYVGCSALGASRGSDGFCVLEVTRSRVSRLMTAVSDALVGPGARKHVCLLLVCS